MGVLAGRFPGKVKEEKSEALFNKVAGFFKNLVSHAENFGVAVAEREVEALMGKEKKYFYF